MATTPAPEDRPAAEDSSTPVDEAHAEPESLSASPSDATPPADEDGVSEDSEHKASARAASSSYDNETLSSPASESCDRGDFRDAFLALLKAVLDRCSRFSQKEVRAVCRDWISRSYVPTDDEMLHPWKLAFLSSSASVSSTCAHEMRRLVRRFPWLVRQLAQTPVRLLTLRTPVQWQDEMEETALDLLVQYVSAAMVKHKDGTSQYMRLLLAFKTQLPSWSSRALTLSIHASVQRAASRADSALRERLQSALFQLCASAFSVLSDETASEAAAQTVLAQLGLLAENKPPVSLACSDGGTLQEAVARSLSLHTLALLLADFGPRLLSSAELTASVRDHVVTALFEASVSTQREVFRHGLNCFVVLLRSARWRQALRQEIGALLTSSYLRLLGGQHGGAGSHGVSWHSHGVAHQLQVVQALAVLAVDQRALVELFLNYDCADTPAFQTLMESLAHLATAVPPPGANSVDLLAHAALRRESLQTLVSAVKSMREWMSASAAAQEQQYEDVEEEEVQESTSSRTSHSRTPSVLSTDANSYGETFAQAQQRRRALQDGVVKFNLKATDGVRRLAQDGFVDAESAASVADFLMQHHAQLDATQLGNYLGRSDDLCRQVLHEFVSRMRFADMPFVDALRHFLGAYFMMPGEGPIVDRFMQVFGAQYFEQNPDAVRNADDAYSLAFAAVLLNSDLHNPRVKRTKRMSKPTFVANTRKMDPTLEESLLERIYDDIAKEEITLMATGKRRQRRRSLRAPKPLPSVDTWRTAQLERDHEVVSLMFSVVWPSLLSALSQLQQRHGGGGDNATLNAEASTDGASTETSELQDTCLTAYREAMRIACHFAQSDEALLFATSWASATSLPQLLTETARPIPLRSSNVRALQVLFALALERADELGAAWQPVLQCATATQALGALLSSSQRSDLLPHGADHTSVLYENARRLEGSLDEHAVHALFQSSPQLGAAGIVDLVSAMCQVAQALPRRMRSLRIDALNRIVEVASYNMGRVRLEWNAIWTHVVNFLDTLAAANDEDDEDVVVVAVNSLRMLASRFLAQPELSNFSFQAACFAPFASLMRKQRSRRVRQTILASVEQLAQRQGAQFRSAWRAVFEVFAVASRQHHRHGEDEELVRSAWRALDELLQQHAETVRQVDLSLRHEAPSQYRQLSVQSAMTQALRAFAECAFTDVGVCAMEWLLRLQYRWKADADAESETSNQEAEDKEEAEEDGASDGDRKTDHDGDHCDRTCDLSTVTVGLATMCHGRLFRVSPASLQALLGLVHRRGHTFSAQAWRVVFLDVLRPVLRGELGVDQRQGMASVKAESLEQLLQLFQQVLDGCTSIVVQGRLPGRTQEGETAKLLSSQTTLPLLLTLFEDALLRQQTAEALQTGATCHDHFVQTLARRLSSSESDEADCWSLLTHHLCRLLRPPSAVSFETVRKELGSPLASTASSSGEDESGHNARLLQPMEADALQQSCRQQRYLAHSVFRLVTGFTHSAAALSSDDTDLPARESSARGLTDELLQAQVQALSTALSAATQLRLRAPAAASEETSHRREEQLRAVLQLEHFLLRRYAQLLVHVYGMPTPERTPDSDLGGSLIWQATARTLKQVVEIRARNAVPSTAALDVAALLLRAVRDVWRQDLLERHAPKLLLLLADAAAHLPDALLRRLAADVLAQRFSPLVQRAVGAEELH